MRVFVGKSLSGGLRARLTVLGGRGAWPEPGSGRGGGLVEPDGFRLVPDLGYATMSRLPDRVDAVFISHGHPDHCADLRAHPGRGPGLVVTPR